MQATRTRNQLRTCVLLQLGCFLMVSAASDRTQAIASTRDGTRGTVSLLLLLAVSSWRLARSSLSMVSRILPQISVSGYVRACVWLRSYVLRPYHRHGPSPIVFVAQQPAPAALREAPCAISVVRRRGANMADTAVRSVDVDLMTAQHNCVCAQDGLAHRRQLLSISALSDTQFAVDAALCGAAVKVRRQGSPRRVAGLQDSTTPQV